LPAGKIVHAILDNYATHKHPRFAPGWHVIRAGCSTSPPPRAPGSTRWRTSSPLSPDDASAVVYSRPSSTFSPPSTDTSTTTTPTQSPSSGPSQPRTSSPKSNDCLYLSYESVH